MPGRLSALMYSAAPKCRLGRSPKKVSTVAGMGKGATRFGPKRPATTGAVRERAQRAVARVPQDAVGPRGHAQLGAAALVVDAL